MELQMVVKSKCTAQTSARSHVARWSALCDAGTRMHIRPQNSLEMHMDSPDKVFGLEVERLRSNPVDASAQ